MGLGTGPARGPPWPRQQKQSAEDTGHLEPVHPHAGDGNQVSTTRPAPAAPATIRRVQLTVVAATKATTTAGMT